MACQGCPCDGSMFYNDQQTKNSPVTKEEIRENIRMIETHRMLVYAIGKTVYPEYDFIAHDLSKFSPEELEPYTIKFIQKKSEEENPSWQGALQHHYDNNPHHPQFWKGGSMPEQFLKESIIDMVAAKYQYQSNGEAIPEHLTSEMFQFKDFFLERYTEDDRKAVKMESERLQAIDWTTIPVVGRNFSKEL